MEFTLRIKLGNAAMRTSVDVAEALNRVADRLWPEGDAPLTPSSGRVFDVNGNTVGKWSVEA